VGKGSVLVETVVVVVGTVVLGTGRRAVEGRSSGEEIVAVVVRRLLFKSV
jgi:hypothetical protein